MTVRPPDGDAATALRLEQAREVYASLFKALQASVRKLETDEENGSDARHRQELYRAHIKQLQTVFELEGSLGTYGTNAASRRLDLDAARAEIRQRLAWIGERGGDRELP
ncbi:hypothetical protein HMH01_15790 [Halovulum dunhuangense]|uniref:Uncharacterized protein n=1 Tax=Halovulum dunhuangense TaxID=1505036 RepID=A0A849L657_9RHOB|nr:hypothetical protein [Halovulum dunhuangense]NNU81899.1 hypothetical protein [Halovulum dunhuangense]